jgi:hypothetical protein
MTKMKITSSLEGIFYFEKGTTILHREDGPAAVYSNGDKAWYIHGKRHREDGPAQIFSDGKLKWWLNGILFTKERWFEKLSKAQKEKMLYSEYFIGS